MGGFVPRDFQKGYMLGVVREHISRKINEISICTGAGYGGMHVLTTYFSFPGFAGGLACLLEQVVLLEQATKPVNMIFQFVLSAESMRINVDDTC